MTRADDIRVLMDLHEENLALDRLYDPARLADSLDSAVGTVYEVNGYVSRKPDDVPGRVSKLEVTTPWKAFDVHLRLEGDAAWVLSSARATIAWNGDGEPPVPVGEVTTRSTQIYRRTPDGWALAHAHLSPASTAPRPGGIG
ncbi:nuclear transport factor 2 family protein [Mycobacterium sp. NAZ190054]|uniref:nuclear transport factor 2 family protein n=1 Tax=Mycobacterium sp. NAZ190054 TaxID=1747766 RepID=UPI000AC6D8C3|nr:nuclear transport factor 2 family protein [Mycobacterium sp. NAZ190054]